MTILANAALFFLGIVMAIQVASSLYGIIDHWYRIARYWRRVLTAIVLWTAGYWVIALALEPQGRAAYFTGSLFWLAMHILTGLAMYLPLALDQLKQQRVYKALVMEEQKRKQPG